MVFISRQEPFVCGHCGIDVDPLPHGTCRNHCPVCLWSKHVDLDGPGDRASTCLGLLRPTGIDHDGKKGWIIIHECVLCTKRQPNKTAPDDDVDAISGLR